MEFWDMAVRMVSSLLLVVALMLILSAAAKRLFGVRLPVAAGQTHVQVVGSGYLGPRKTVSLVAVAGELLIVGTTQNDIVPLGRVTDAERIKQVLSSGTHGEGLSEGNLWASWRRSIGLPDGRSGSSEDKGGHAPR